MAEVVCTRRVVRVMDRVVDRLDAGLHRVKMRLRVLELRRDPELSREMDELERDPRRLAPSPTADADLDSFIAELERTL